MIVEYIRYSIAEADRATFETAYQRAQAALTRSPHCLAYETGAMCRGSWFLHPAH